MECKLDRNSSTPPYRQIADAVRTAIMSGEFPPGSRIPSRSVMTREFGVSMATVCRAYEELTAEGLIVSQQGAGTFVRTGPAVSLRSSPALAEMVQLLLVTLSAVNPEAADPLYQWHRDRLRRWATLVDKQRHGVQALLNENRLSEP